MAGNTVVVRFIGDDSSLRRAANRSASSLDAMGPSITRIGLGLAGLGVASSLAGVAMVAGMAMVPLAIAGVAALILSKNEEIAKSFSNIGTQLNASLQTAVKPLVPVFLGIANDLSKLIKDMTPQLSALFAAAGPSIRLFADAIMGLIRWLVPNLTSLVKAAQPFVAVFLQGFASLGPKIEQMFAAMAVGSEGAKTGFLGFMTVLGNVLVIVGQVVGWLAQMSPALTQLIVPGLAVVGFIKAWTIAQGILNVVLAANPIGIVIMAIAALVGILVYAWQNSETFRSIVIGVFSAVGAYIGFVVNGVVSGWQRVVAFFRAIPGAVGSALGSLGNIIGGAFKGAMNMAINFINSGIDSINMLIGGINAINPFGSIGMIPHIPRFHQGGMVPGVRGQEVLAVLQAGETVSAIGHNPGGSGGGGSLRVSGSADSKVAELINYLARTGQLTIA
jgi:phage-related protein